MCETFETGRLVVWRSVVVPKGLRARGFMFRVRIGVPLLRCVVWVCVVSIRSCVCQLEKMIVFRRCVSVHMLAGAMLACWHFG